MKQKIYITEEERRKCQRVADAFVELEDEDIVGVCGGIALRLVVYFKAKNAKKFRHGMEYGSARWGA